MRNITFAIYKGIEYSAGIKKDGRIVLRSEDDASKKEGFVEKEIGNNRIYIKYVQKDEIEEIYDKKTYAVYEGYKFIVVDETEKQILILTMNGDYQEWIRLGMECIDKGMYQKWMNKNEAEIEVLKEIEELYRYATYAVINNYKVNVEKENEEYYFVGTADCKVAEALGLQRCDKYYYEGKFPKQDVEIIEEKEKIEL